MTAPLRAPFPWFGGKSRAAALIWQAFGDVPNYVEPFAGSLAVLLRRPHAPRVETVNDRDCYLANFWRAVQDRPGLVARWADWPVNEADLHARHRWLVRQTKFRKRMRKDPAYYHPKIAGWWVWGLSQWIGSGWCASEPLANGEVPSEQHKKPGARGVGVLGARSRGGMTHEQAVRPDLSGHRGVTASRLRDISGAARWEKRPELSTRGGRGVGARRLSEQMPDLSGDSGAAGRGVRAGRLREQMPRVGGTGTGGGGAGVHGRRMHRTEGLYRWMEDLQARLRHVRVCCGDFERVLGPSVTEKIGLTGVLLDPPYAHDAGRDPSVYAEEDAGASRRAREWALANGDNPRLRIALCGFEGEHEMPATWQCVPWKASGGYAAAAGNTENAHRERIWFSPACLKVEPAQRELFAEAAHG